ncbi:MAG: hypothetical protein AAFX80_16850, partial [Cyanobacteria bacterium J06639_18]
MPQIENIENLIDMDPLRCPSKKNNTTIEQAQADILSYIREICNNELKRFEDVKNIIATEIPIN